MRIELDQKNKMEMETLRKEMEKLKREVTDRSKDQSRKTDVLDSEVRAREGAIPKVRNTGNYSEEGNVQDPQVTSLGREATEAATGLRHTPRVEHITPQNREFVSEEMMGLIVNPDGSFVMTPQWKTWVKNTELQLVKYYRNTPDEFPMSIQR